MNCLTMEPENWVETIRIFSHWKPKNQVETNHESSHNGKW